MARYFQRFSNSDTKRDTWLALICLLTLILLLLPIALDLYAASDTAVPADTSTTPTAAPARH